MQELWVPITGFEWAYEISSLGRIRSKDREVGHISGKAIKRGKVLKLQADKDGYASVALSTSSKLTTCKVHRMVAEHFLPKSTLPEVNHKDFDKSNNDFENLVWSSRKSNQEHASKGGKFAAASNQRRAKKLTPDLARDIRIAREEGVTYAALATRFGISAPTALKVVRGEIWA